MTLKNLKNRIHWIPHWMFIGTFQFWHLNHQLGRGHQDGQSKVTVGHGFQDQPNASMMFGQLEESHHPEEPQPGTRNHGENRVKTTETEVQSLIYSFLRKNCLMQLDSTEFWHVHRPCRKFHIRWAKLQSDDCPLPLPCVTQTFSPHCPDGLLFFPDGLLFFAVACSGACPAARMSMMFKGVLARKMSRMSVRVGVSFPPFGLDCCLDYRSVE